MNKKLILLAGVLAVFFIVSCGDNMDTCEDQSVTTWDNGIQSIINSNCATEVACHGAGSALDYSSYDNIKPKLNEELFEKRVLVDQDMPPIGELSDATLQTLQCWADNGYPES